MKKDFLHPTQYFQLEYLMYISHDLEYKKCPNIGAKKNHWKRKRKFKNIFFPTKFKGNIIELTFNSIF